MLVADRGADAPLATDTITFAEDSVYKSDGKSRRSRCFNNLDGSLLGLDEQRTVKENNDDIERMARRRSRLLEPHPDVVNSPAHDAARRSVASQVMPRTQIGEHYGNCIRLAAENKITYKNAFDLHLIDYMGEMIKKEDFTSFRMASSSLDASAKIYAGRVDAVHQETYKVLTGLGRSDKSSKSEVDKVGENQGGNNQTPDELDGSTDDVGVSENNRKKKDRRRAPNARNVITTTLSKIRSKVKAFEADVDPLFQQQAAAYDDGGTVELCLNRLRTRSKYSELLQDSNTPLFSHADSVLSTCCIKPVELCPVIDSRSLEAPLCVAFDNFHFDDAEYCSSCAHLDPVTPVAMGGDYGSGNATPVPRVSPPLMDLDDDDTAMLLVVGNEDDGDVTLVNEGNEKLANVDVRVVDAVPEPVAEPTAEGELFVSSLKLMLASHLENFGQVNDGILGLWAGPEHWRKKAKRRRLDEFGNAELIENEENVTTIGKSGRAKITKKAKKANVEYDTALLDAGENRSKSGCLVRNDWSKQLELYTKHSGKSPILREQNRRLAGERFNILPPSITDARQNIYELFNREIMCNIVDAKTNETHENATAHAMAEGGIVPPWLDSQAAASAAEDGCQDVDVDNVDHIPVDDDDDEIAPYDGIFTQQIAGENLGALQMEDEDGVQLVAPPRHVARLEIGYARAAKLINVRHLKSVLWSMIEANLAGGLDLSPPSKKPRVSVEDEGGAAKKSMEFPTCYFGDILTGLPAKVSKQTAGELSVAIGLNCLLHLANEKDLFIESGEDCADLSIFQGLSVAEQELISQYKRCSDGFEVRRSKKQVSLDSWLESSVVNGN